MSSPWFCDPALETAMFGMVFGLLPALPPFFWTRRGEILLLAAFLGPIILFLAINLTGPSIVAIPLAQPW